jgi:hypothetical protein
VAINGLVVAHSRLRITPWIGGQMKLSTMPAAMAAKAVTIGTNRLPAKNPR